MSHEPRSEAHVIKPLRPETKIVLVFAVVQVVLSLIHRETAFSGTLMSMMKERIPWVSVGLSGLFNGVLYGVVHLFLWRHLPQSVPMTTFTFGGIYILYRYADSVVLTMDGFGIANALSSGPLVLAGTWQWCSRLGSSLL